MIVLIYIWSALQKIQKKKGKKIIFDRDQAIEKKVGSFVGGMSCPGFSFPRHWLRKSFLLLLL